MSESLRILLMEDNPFDTELVQLELREAGTIFTSKLDMNEKDYVHELQEFFPDLVLSDLIFPHTMVHRHLLSQKDDSPIPLLFRSLERSVKTGQSGELDKRATFYFTAASAEFISRKDDQIPKMAITGNSGVNPESEL